MLRNREKVWNNHVESDQKVTKRLVASAWEHSKDSNEVEE